MTQTRRAKQNKNNPPQNKALNGVFGPRHRLFQEMGIHGSGWGRGNPKDRVDSLQEGPSEVTFESLFRSLSSFWGLGGLYGLHPNPSLTIPVIPIFRGQKRYHKRNCVTKILPNVRVNFLVRFASKPLF